MIVHSAYTEDRVLEASLYELRRFCGFNTDSEKERKETYGSHECLATCYKHMRGIMNRCLLSRREDTLAQPTSLRKSET